MNTTNGSRQSAFAFSVCAFSPCRRTFEQATNRFGVFCSDRCMRAEVETPGTFAPNLTLAEAQDDEFFASWRRKQL